MLPAKSSTARPMSTMHFCKRRAASPSNQAYDVNKSPEIPCDAQASPPSDFEIMARPTKPKTLAQIIAEGKAFRAAALPVAKGSAFDKLSQKNRAFLNSMTRKDNFIKKTTDVDDSNLPVTEKVVKISNGTQKVKKKAIKRPVAPKPQRTPTLPPPPVIESWRTAAGATIGSDVHSVPTPFLGIARVPIWMEQDFKTALRAILDAVGGAEEFATDVHESGGEFYSEISARFVDEEEAGRVLEKINGVSCCGRRLQVSFTTDF